MLEFLKKVKGNYLLPVVEQKMGLRGRPGRRVRPGGPGVACWSCGGVGQSWSREVVLAARRVESN